MSSLPWWRGYSVSICLLTVFLRGASKRSTLTLLFFSFFFDHLCVLCAALENSDGIRYGWRRGGGQNTPSSREGISRKLFRKIKGHFLEIKCKWYLHFSFELLNLLPCHFVSENQPFNWNSSYLGKQISYFFGKKKRKERCLVQELESKTRCLNLFKDRASQIQGRPSYKKAQHIWLAVSRKETLPDADPARIWSRRGFFFQCLSAFFSPTFETVYHFNVSSVKGLIKSDSSPEDKQVSW